MRQQLARHEVPQPSFAVVRTPEEAIRALGEIGVPAVLKPVDSGGQRGVPCSPTHLPLADKPSSIQNERPRYKVSPVSTS